MVCAVANHVEDFDRILRELRPDLPLAEESIGIGRASDAHPIDVVTDDDEPSSGIGEPEGERVEAASLLGRRVNVREQYEVELEAELGELLDRGVMDRDGEPLLLGSAGKTIEGDVSDVHGGRLDPTRGEPQGVAPLPSTEVDRGTRSHALDDADDGRIRLTDPESIVLAIACVPGLSHRLVHSASSVWLFDEATAPALRAPVAAMAHHGRALIVHPSDWQIGVPARTMTKEARHRFRHDRVDAAEHLLAGASSRGAACVIVAADLLDDNTLCEDQIQRIVDVIARQQLPVVALPGNHDALEPHAIFGRDDLLIVLDSYEPRTLVPGLEVLGAPWRSRLPGRNPDWALAVSLEPTRPPMIERVRVGRWRILTLEEAVATADDVAAIAVQLRALEDPARCVVRVRLEGSLPLAARLTLERDLEAAAAALASFELDVGRVASLSDISAPTDFSLQGAAATVFERLLADSDPVSQAALRLLARLAIEEVG